VSRYVLFVLDLGHPTQRIAEGRVAFAPDPAIQPETAFEWRIVHDVTGKVCIWLRLERVELVATAQFRDGALADLRQVAPDVPTDWQWAVVEQTLKSALDRAESANAPAPPDGHEPDKLPRKAFLGNAGFDRALAEREYSAQKPHVEPDPPHHRPDKPQKPPKQKKKKGDDVLGTVYVVATIGVVIVAGIVTGVKECSKPTKPKTSTATATKATTKPVRPTPPPDAAPASLPASIAEAVSQSTDLADPMNPLVRYAAARLRWADVATADTTLLKADKDLGAERGKRLCATGTITTIERFDIDHRKVFAGRLDTTDDEPLAFVAVGSTGELVKRSQATLCGIVTAKANGAVGVVGMFDLPENRSPSVEQ
jgi:hypothetical protein